MLNALLPSFTFISDDGSESRLDLRNFAGVIRARAEFLRSSLEPGSAVGLMLPSGPELVLDWMATLVGGLKPLIMQYPTAKQARNYWISSVSNTVATVNLGAVVCDAYSRDLGMGEITKIVLQESLPSAAPAPGGDLEVGEFEILQLSSGTTGYRKGIIFDSATLKRHAEDFGSALGLTRTDRIVSWLPLYHDMGYIGCFVMPLILGIDVIMMDPMTWIRQPELFFDAIERHAGTACFMPNFGYDLMSRGTPRRLPSMRRWICGGEPISAATAKRFIDATGADPATFWPLYGMAENIVGLTTRSGVQTRRIDDNDVISCGPPIPGVELKTVEGEIWVRSGTAIDGYIGMPLSKDADGFYATGDMGTLVEGELYVSGRKQDLLIQAGRKFLLSDVDLRINELLPEVRGRAVALAIRDEQLGTETLTALIESPDFIEREDRQQVEGRLRSTCGIDQLSAAFVPPRFLTKTSSGKFNRKASGGDWQARNRAKKEGERGDLLSVLDRYRDAPWDERVDALFDSLSLTVLRSVMRDARLKFDGALTMRQIEESIRRSLSATPVETRNDTIRIVSMSERALLNRFRPQHFEALAAAVGHPVEFEHVCVPPSGIVLSDLVFQDYFSSRLPPGNFESVGRVLDKLRGASVILADDTPELLWPGEQVYGVLSHNLERDPRADRISFRWQAYARQHDVLPLTVVSGIDLPLSNASRSLRLLSKYLRVPVFRMANHPGFEDYTADWEYRPFTANAFHGIDPDAFVAALAAFIRNLSSPVALRAAQQTTLFELSDPPHFCTHLIGQAPIDDLIDRFDSFCIAGPPASAPYVRKEIERRGKRCSQLMSFAPEVLATLREPFDCLLTTGAIGPFPIDGKLRVAALQHIGRPWRTQNLDGIDVTRGHEIPPSTRDWYYPFDLDRQRDGAQWMAVRKALEPKSKKIEGAVI